jgi:hypothetical protein
MARVVSGGREMKDFLYYFGIIFTLLCVVVASISLPLSIGILAAKTFGIPVGVTLGTILMIAVVSAIIALNEVILNK